MNVLTAYKKDLASCVNLHPSEALRFKSLMDQGDLSARDTLIESILRMAWNIAKEYVGKSTLGLEDLVGVANRYAIQAVDTWSPERGGSLTTHTHWVVNHGLLHALLKEGHKGIYLPKTARLAIKDPNSTAKHAINARAAFHMASVEGLQKDEGLDLLASQDQEEYGNVCLSDIEEYVEKHLKGPTLMVCRMYFGLGNEEATRVKEISEKLGLRMYEVQRLLKPAIKGMKERFSRRKGICQWCQDPFMRETAYLNRCCSPECQKKFRNAVRRAQTSDRRLVYHCERCKNSIPHKSKRIRYCSKMCATLVKLEQARTKRKTKTNTLPSQQCKVCNQDFTPNSPRKREYCSVKCCNRRKGQKAKWSIECKVCNKKVPTNIQRQAYCSIDCRKVGSRLHKQEIRAVSRQRRAG